MIQDTICALATAPGGAIAVIRISGHDSIMAADAIFSRSLSNAPASRVLYGNIIAPDAGNAVIDDVLLTVFRAPHSYTGEDSVEISCHASQYVVSEILRLLRLNGCRQALPGEYTQRAFLNGKLDLSQAEAVADLIASSSHAQHQMAMNQLRGGFSQRLSQLRGQLLHLTSLLELELDFSDHEELEFADRTELHRLADEIEAEVARLADSFRLGNAIKNGIPVAIIGAPNVGKSTLLNRLLGEEKAIVSDIEGTTRDIIEDTLNIHGTTFRFLDTAGIRNTTDRIEQLGIDRSMLAAERAQVILLLTEPGIPYPDLTPRPDQTVIRVLTKSDNYATDCTDNNHSVDAPLAISALTGAGIPQLEERLLAAIPSVPEADIIVSNARHHEALVRALASIRTVQSGLSDGIPSDLISLDLRQCIDSLGEITCEGTITAQDTLNNIFSRFCVGK